jgi:hypothetical protein
MMFRTPDLTEGEGRLGEDVCSNFDAVTIAGDDIMEAAAG